MEGIRRELKDGSPERQMRPKGIIQEALTRFHSSLEHRLAQEEAASRLKKDGFLRNG